MKSKTGRLGFWHVENAAREVHLHWLKAKAFLKREQEND